jgi:1-acyl-sn-glycerol-3-phosphate acyltransferase
MNPGIIASGFVSAAGSRGLRGCRYLIRKLYQPLAFYGLLVLFALSCLVWGLVAALVFPLVPRHLRRPTGQFLIMGGFRYFVAVMQASGLVRCDLTALDALRDKGPLIIAPNHPSLLDVVLIISRLPRVICTAKAKLLNNLLFGASARLAGYIRNDAPLHLIREGVRQLRDGRQLLIFPEGTRSRSTGIEDFKGGFALIAQQAGVPIQTIFIDSNSRFLGKGWPLLRLPDFPLVYRVRLGPVLTVAGNRSDFVAALQQSYCRELSGRPS